MNGVIPKIHHQAYQQKESEPTHLLKEYHPYSKSMLLFKNRGILHIQKNHMNPGHLQSTDFEKYMDNVL